MAETYNKNLMLAKMLQGNIGGNTSSAYGGANKILSGLLAGYGMNKGMAEEEAKYQEQLKAQAELQRRKQAMEDLQMSKLQKEIEYMPDQRAKMAREMQNQDLANQLTLAKIQALTGQGAGEATSVDGINIPLAQQEKKKFYETQGKLKAETLDSLKSMTSKLPELEGTVEKLGDLSNRATYTTIGRGVDLLSKEIGMGATEGSIARKEYESAVSNQILPLLRDTFGAQFTEREGQTLRETLGDPNSAPAEKQAILKSFIDQKKRSILSTANQLGLTPEQLQAISQDRFSQPQEQIQQMPSAMYNKSSNAVDYSEYFK